MIPDDSVQSLVATGNWWVTQSETKPVRGSLIFAFVPHFDQRPYAFEPIGRSDPRSHDSARVRVQPIAVDQPLKPSNLPVAAMPLGNNEIWAAYRAKRRPCLVLGDSASNVSKHVTRGRPKHATAPTLLVAPYYGAKGSAKRAGYSDEFIERVRHCEHSQFFWEYLPHDGGEESILRLDQLQPIGAHYQAYKLSTYKLSQEALELLDHYMQWLIWGEMSEDSPLVSYRELIVEIVGS